MSIDKSRIIAIILFVLAIGLVIGVFLYSRPTNFADKSKPTVQSDTEVLVAQVSKLIVLPVGEDPTVVVVTDITKLQSQAFFANAVNGDKVLIYTKAKNLFSANMAEIIKNKA